MSSETKVVRAKRYVVYLPRPFIASKNEEVLSKVLEVAKKLFKGVTVTARGTGIYVSFDESTKTFEEDIEPVKMLEIVTTDDRAGIKAEQVAYAVMVALDENRPVEELEKVVMFTEEDIILHSIGNPELPAIQGKERKR